MTIDETEFVDEQDSTIPDVETEKFSEAVLYSVDWTVETLVSQLVRGNIEMNPRFQRRDAWSVRRKSAFIESLILGLPVPQVVLAEKKGQRGQYIVLDGKQRLLSLLQFTGHAEGPHNSFRLIGLEGRDDLLGMTFEALGAPGSANDLNAFSNYSVRTVVIRNWPNFDFLHLVFLRLNTGSVKLSPQELRQAMFPGAFSDFVDDQASASNEVKALLNTDLVDPRMRDVELLVRFLAFHFRLPSYVGRMKTFLDEACGDFNARWNIHEGDVRSATAAFNAGTATLIEIFGARRVARKADSRSFNRAIFDALIFYAANETIRTAMTAHADAVHDAYMQTLQDPDFITAVESDTAGVPNTYARLRKWGERLRDAIGVNFQLPEFLDADPALGRRTSITFNGLGV